MYSRRFSFLLVAELESLFGDFELNALKIHFSFPLSKESLVMKMSTLSLWTHVMSHKFALCPSFHLTCYLGWQLPSAADPTGNFERIYWDTAQPMVLAIRHAFWVLVSMIRPLGAHRPFSELVHFLTRVSRNFWILSHCGQAMCTKEFLFRLCNEVPHHPHLCTTMPTPCWKLCWSTVLRSRTVETIFFNIYLGISKVTLPCQ